MVALAQKIPAHREVPQSYLSRDLQSRDLQKVTTRHKSAASGGVHHLSFRHICKEVWSVHLNTCQQVCAQSISASRPNTCASARRACVRHALFQSVLKGVQRLWHVQLQWTNQTSFVQRVYTFKLRSRLMIIDRGRQV